MAAGGPDALPVYAIAVDQHQSLHHRVDKFTRSLSRPATRTEFIWLHSTWSRTAIYRNPLTLREEDLNWITSQLFLLGLQIAGIAIQCSPNGLEADMRILAARLKKDRNKCPTRLIVILDIANGACKVNHVFKRHRLADVF